MPGEDELSQILLRRWQAGDERAAAEIFDRYVQRLVALAQRRISPKLQRRVDPEDVVQSAYRSFFRQARDGRFAWGRSGDLWRLLAAITVHKTLGQVEFHRAAKRSVDVEGGLVDATHGVAPQAVCREPTPVEVAGVVDELECFMRPLDAMERQVLTMRLQDCSVDEIADAIGRSSRTVRRLLERLLAGLRERLEAPGAHDP